MHRGGRESKPCMSSESFERVYQAKLSEREETGIREKTMGSESVALKRILVRDPKHGFDIRDGGSPKGSRLLHSYSSVQKAIYFSQNRHLPQNSLTLDRLTATNPHRTHPMPCSQAPKQSLRGRTIKIKDPCDKVTATLAPKLKKHVQKSVPKAPPPPRERSPSESSGNNEGRVEEDANPSLKHGNTSIDVSQCLFRVVCITKFNNKDLTPDEYTVRLDELKVHEYNARATTMVHIAASKARVGYELESAVASTSGVRLKKSAKEIRDRTDWESLEKTIKWQMESKIKNILVEYIVTYAKTCRHGNSDESEVAKGLDNAVKSLQKTDKRAMYFLTLLY